MDETAKKPIDAFANKTIDALGGTSAVARLCDIKPPSVHAWRETGIPKSWLRWFKCIRPDLFRDAKAPRKCKAKAA